MNTQDHPDDTGFIGMARMLAWACAFGALLGSVLSAVHLTA